MDVLETAEQALALLRRQRHSFANHLQVISGWLQLGRSERALVYLRGLAERMAGEGAVVRHLPPELVLVLTDLSLEAETYGVLLQWHSLGPIQPGRIPTAAMTRAELSAAIRAASSLSEPHRTVTVAAGPEGISVHTGNRTGEG